MAAFGLTTDFSLSLVVAFEPETDSGVVAAGLSIQFECDVGAVDGVVFDAVAVGYTTPYRAVPSGLRKRWGRQWRIDERFDHYQHALTDIIEKASRRAVEYTHQFEKPVVVLEDLSDIREGLDYGEWMNRRLHAWAFARLQERIEDKAREAGIPVEYIEPSYTSQTCHECGHVGSRNGDEFRCQNGECWVTECHADINAAVNIADRHDPWGESLPLKSASDDISRGGSARDSATTPTEQSHPQQMTPGEAGSEPTAGG